MALMRIKTQNLDHLGLVAGMCDEIGIVRLIDQACGQQATNKHLTYGQCVKSMILNGLGFVGRTLYLYSEYFEDKPIDLLLGAPVKPQHVDDNVLGRTLDKLFSLGVTELYTQIALCALRNLGIQVQSLHLDSTSFHVDGEYHSLLEQGESRIQLVPGYSRDHRPELNQAVLQLITSNQGNIPLFMQAASGNSADKTAFAEIVKQHIKSFQEAVNNRYIVADSALYTPESLHALQEAKSCFVTRVPMTLNEAKSLIRTANRLEMMDLGNGYYGQEYQSSYANVRQRWILVFSEAAYQRECRTLKKHFQKGSEKESRDFEKLSREVFSCRNDAIKHFEEFNSKLKYIDIIDPWIVEVKKHSKIGRPKKDLSPSTVGYQICGHVASSLVKKSVLEGNKGYFILATNDMDRVEFSAGEVLKTYKSQQSVERGFRFLKSPDFLVSSFFLKKPERIEALLMVMTLCLLVYAAVEHKVRQKLRELGEHFPDQKKKPSQNPTARWIFFCFLGLHVVIVNGKKRQVTNLKRRHEIILMCLGPPFQKFYYAETW
jgi:transposase